MRGFEAHDATALAELVEAKEVSPAELVEAAIAGVEAVNPALHAVITPMYEEARRTAAGPLPKGPFTGVPFLLKDLVASYAGVPLAGGSAALRGYVPDHDSELVRRFKQAGLVVVGKTNTPELGLVPTTEPRAFGATRNPWDPARTPGGSSGGSAAAVAAGMVPMAHGNDGGGSIRIPASCCGVFGLKPSRGRVPVGPDFGELLEGFVVEHALTRSVRDSARLLDAIAGPEPGDPYAAPARERPYADEVGRDPGRLRVAFSTRAPTGVAVHAECKAAVERTAALLAALGHEVVEDEPALDGADVSQAFVAVWTSGTAVDLEHLALARGAPVGPEDVEPLTWALAEVGRSMTATAYLQAMERLQAASRVLGRFLERHDLWLTPTLAEPPLVLGALDAPPEAPLTALMRASEWVPHTPIANFSGVPAMSVPLHLTPEGLPVGAHFFARLGAEGLLFRVAAQLEAAAPWAARRPPIHVSR